jgi:hypothetical protein
MNATYYLNLKNWQISGPFTDEERADMGEPPGMRWVTETPCTDLEPGDTVTIHPHTWAGVIAVDQEGQGAATVTVEEFDPTRNRWHKTAHRCPAGSTWNRWTP